MIRVEAVMPPMPMRPSDASIRASTAMIPRPRLMIAACTTFSSTSETLALTAARAYAPSASS